jgi:hypothetical protein
MTGKTSIKVQEPKKEKMPSEKAQRAGLHKQLRKTKFCMYHLQGACRFGSECAFAHSLSDMHSTPDLRKTQLCQAWVNGGCTDKNCNFAHSEYELRSTDVFFKKTLCIWNEKGKCRNGSQCRFAHGITELRSDAFKNDSVAVAALGLGLSPEDVCAPPDPPKRETKGKTITTSHKSPKVDKNDKQQAQLLAAFSQVDNDGPMKVLPCAPGFSQQVMGVPPPPQPPQPPQERQPSNTIADALEALQFELRNAVTQASVQQQANASGMNRSSLQNDLDDLRQSVAMLTNSCSRLQERVDLTPEQPAGLRLSPNLNYTGQYDLHDLARLPMPGMDRDFGAFGGYPMQYGAGDYLRLASAECDSGM